MNDILTLQQLKDINPHTIFAKGENSVEDYWNASMQMQIRWVAVRGEIHDWAIYYMPIEENWSDEMIMSVGEKMHNPESIRKCVPCDDEAFAMYRY